jgi:hypothetical protein
MRLLSAVILTCLLATPALALPDYVRAALPDAQKVGKGRLKLMFWQLYDATLYAPNGQWREDAPFALTLSYLRPFTGKDIANATIDEFVRMDIHDPALLNPWKNQLYTLFPDVKKGDTITGLRLPDGRTAFYHNGTRTGVMDDPAFTKPFFDIWLGKQTRSLYLRNQLLGKAT